MQKRHNSSALAIDMFVRVCMCEKENNIKRKKADESTMREGVNETDRQKGWGWGGGLGGWGWGLMWSPCGRTHITV